MPLFVIEHKTTGVASILPGSIYWLKLLLDAQIDAYLNGADSLNLPTDGVLYDVLRKIPLSPLLATPMAARKYTRATKTQEPRLYANQRSCDETPDEFHERCLAKICECPEKFFQRQTIVRLQAEREEAQRDVWHTATRIRDAKRLKIYSRNPDACVSYGSTCDYFAVCTSSADIHDPLLFRKQELDNEELGKDADGLLTQSAIRCFRACERRYLYRYVMRMRPMALTAEPLRMGTSIHRALETWWRSEGDIAAALDKLDKEDPYLNAKERAMMMGYHVRWGKPPKTDWVEKFFRMPLVNPDTGCASKTFELAGKIDAIADIEEVRPTGEAEGENEECLST